VKKIVFVAQSLRRGGAERVVSLLSKYFNENGFDVKIVLFDNKIEYDYGGKIIDIFTPASKNYMIKLLRLFQRIKKLRKIFKKEKPDYIFSFMESSNFASILTGFDVVVSVRNNPERKHNWYQKLLMKYLYKRENVKKVVTVSKEIEKILNTKYKIQNTKTIYNPLIIDENYKIKENLQKYQPFILGVGRLHEQKNFELLINAFNRTKAKKYTKLLIVGEGEEREKLEELIDALNLRSKVFLVGKKFNIKDYYLQCDMFVLSSKYEGFPNVLVEALSNGCACIATDCPTGPNEIIKYNENGLLIENNNEEELRDSIDKLFFDKSLKEELRKNAKKSVEFLKIDNIAKEWLKI